MSALTGNGPSPSRPVIAIGASAGGLEASRTLLKLLHPDLPAALILVLHLDPSHDSMMVGLLEPDMGLTVVEAVDAMPLCEGRVHVIPPGVFLTVEEGVLRLAPPAHGKPVRLPFDTLLRSLAHEANTQTTCIILSGTGTDGSIGIEALADSGAVVIAQDPHEAGYRGMPEAAIATGRVDHILKTAAMPAVIDAILARGPRKPAPRAGGASAAVRTGASDTAFTAIIDLVGRHTKQDISLYKPGTLTRRIERRMALAACGKDGADRYLAILRSDADELTRLSADLLIHVTGFFRDPAVFAELRDRTIPDLLSALPPGRPLRLWVAGCSNGEEAYSLAIICLEAMAQTGITAGLQIFATDVDPEAIATARDGFYPAEIATSVSADRLARFFLPDENGWRVTPALRETLVFAEADLLSDPPFSRLDLVSCRNVLIYLGAEAQRRVIGLCSFALRPDGLLLLGQAETPGPEDGRFTLANKDARLWRRNGRAQSDGLFATAGPRPMPVPPVRRTTDLADLCQKILLESYAPAAVLMNRRLECLYFLGSTERYLNLPQGHPDNTFPALIPRFLRVRLREAAALCDARTPLVTVTGGRLSCGAGYSIALHALSAGNEPLLLACFVDDARPLPLSGSATPQSQEGALVPALEAEIATLRDDLLQAQRDLEKAIEANEADTAEARSISEEFQATNEELLASREELQSLNEELTALNGQLQESLERHRTTADDLQNVLYSTDIATLFLDADLNIRFFTPAARTVFRVIATDVGRPLADLAALSEDSGLIPDARAVLKTTVPVEREIAGAGAGATAGEVWFLRRIQPYRTSDGRIDGVVITFTDISERKRTNAALVEAMHEADRVTRAKSRFLAAVSHDLRQPLQSLTLLHGLMARNQQPDEAARLAALLERILGSMTGMLDSLLDVNRIESGIIRPAIRSVPVAPLLERMAEEFGPLCHQKGLRLRVIQSSAWVRTDPQLLEQMLRNLLSNALKYTFRGSILIGCRRRDGAVQLVVCDSGIGVAVSELEAIFEPYYQVGKSTLQSAHGLGLGLSIVRWLGTLLGHPVSLRSVAGTGSAFAITMAQTEAARAIAPPEAGSPEAQPLRRVGRILLVEDDEPLRMLLGGLLETEGHSVIAFGDPKLALHWAGDGNGAPDLLLTDMALRGDMSGLMLATELCRLTASDVPTIILTGDITVATMRSIAATPFHQISKPAALQALLRRVSDILRTSPSDPGDRPAIPGSATIHVVDDDPMIRDTLRRLFESEGWKAATWASAEAFLAGSRPVRGDCLIVDGLLPGQGGVALLETLRRLNIDIPAIILTGHGDAAMAVAAMKAGASDLIEKPASAKDLLSSVARAIAGSPGDQAKSEARRAAQAIFASLTLREHDVLALVLEGAANKNIAAKLGINQRTVENHRAAVMRKTGASSLPSLVRLALVAGVSIT
ncbi:CheR family methyltransferase [Paracoccus sp. IB05]|uniref:CheR family methyltransferase n=1 Tax=Paracoccus sp. IB05 TaxID=2779367 RepID=UPI0018E74DC1|nr:CheR family methyltransferase [Paracoccus sp. IB05]MBJ2150827.1 response regulator [Paracoccus sp. IB05]